MAQPTPHAERIKQELREAGVGWFGFMKFGIRYLHKLIHPDEHIHGIVFGRYRAMPGVLSWEEGMLVATDRRVLFVDRKPGFLRVDDIAYDVVAGVEVSKAGMFSGVTLFTKLGDFPLRFVKSVCAEKFVRYVEMRRLESAEE
ncbi:MAG TPA: PH domain-containing protein [Candidatus Saccharimonadales bacterium]